MLEPKKNQANKQETITVLFIRLVLFSKYDDEFRLSSLWSG